MVGLLTGETIARWLATRLEGRIGFLEEEPVDRVLKHQEAAGYILVGKTATVFDGLKAFDQSLHSGTSLQAITETPKVHPSTRFLQITLSFWPLLTSDRKLSSHQICHLRY